MNRIKTRDISVSLRATARLLFSELSRLGRDPMLLLFCLLSPFIALLFRYLWPLIEVLFLNELAIDISEYRVLMQVILIQFPPSFVGMAFGLLLLEDRDEGILTAIAPTPLGIKGYIAAKLVLGFVISFVESLLIIPIFGPPWPAYFTTAFLATFASPFFSLFLGGIAKNKLEGMTFAKALGILNNAGALAFFFPQGLGLIAAILPTWWSAIHFFSEPDKAGIFLALGISYQLVCLALGWTILKHRLYLSGDYS